jgi:hypothetical protein
VSSPCYNKLILELLKELSKNSAVDNDRPNRAGEALPWSDFQTMVTYGYDQKRPKDEGWWDFVKYLVLKFIIQTVPVVSCGHDTTVMTRFALLQQRDFGADEFIIPPRWVYSR